MLMYVMYVCIYNSGTWTIPYIKCPLCSFHGVVCACKQLVAKKSMFCNTYIFLTKQSATVIQWVHNLKHYAELLIVK